MAYGLGPVCQTFDCACFDPWMVVGLEVQIEVCVGGLPVHSCCQLLPFPVHQDIQERQGAISFRLHRELDSWSLCVEVLEKTFERAVSMGPHYKRIIHIAAPKVGFLICLLNGHGLEELHLDVCKDWGKRRTHRCSLYLFVEVLSVGKVGGGYAELC